MKNMSRASRIFQGLIAIVLILGLLGPAAAPVSARPGAVQPLLAEMALEAPGEMVRVIVQKADTTSRAEALVSRLGGAVLKDLHIINAFAAEMPAESVPALAKNRAVRWVSLDAAVMQSGKGGGGGGKKDGGGSGGEGGDPCADCPLNYYLDTLGVRQVWEMGFQGQGVAVAVIDSGVQNNGPDFVYDPSLRTKEWRSRIVERLAFNEDLAASDNNGHGTHVGGIIGGNGVYSGGLYTGMAPQVELISLSISNATGMAYESDTVDAMQWVLENKARYNIRVVNLSINSTVEQSYHTSPLDAAAEILWFNGIVVVAASGNKGHGQGYNTANAAPANDPFIITVGASLEHATASRADDTVASFSAFGTTTDGFTKPDIIAPGKDIISVLAGRSTWDIEYPERAVMINGEAEYFRISGTSMAAPMVTGAVALLLQAEPDLTPDQVKYRLTHTASNIQNGEGNSYPYLDVAAVLSTPTTESANTGITASQLLWTGDEPVTWNSVNWNSVNWNSVNWNSVNWNAVNWNAVNWNSVLFDD